MEIGSVGIAVVVALGGGVGAVLRFLLDQYLQKARGFSPLRAVNRINFIGSSALALVMGLTSLSVLAWGVGSAAYVCAFFVSLTGGFTTFSTAMVNSLQGTTGFMEAFRVQVLSLVMSVIGFLGMLAVLWLVLLAVGLSTGANLFSFL